MAKLMPALTVVAITALFSGCYGKTSGIDGAALLEARCGACHKTDIPKSARKSKTEWNRCVTRMIARGAILSNEEKRALVKYLARVYKP